MDRRGWGVQETRCLIAIWADESIQRKLEDTYRNRTIYEQISRQMDAHGYSRSWLQCQRKIKHLKTEFRKAKGSDNKPGQDRASFPFYKEMDSVLKDRPSFCPGEDDGVDYELDCYGEPMLSSTIDGLSDSALSPRPAETRGNGGEKDETTGYDSVAPSPSLAPLPSPSTSSSSSPPPPPPPPHNPSSAKRKQTSCVQSRRKKSRLETTLEAFSRAVGTDRDHQLQLEMQRAQHAHEERLFGLMMQSVTSLASSMSPAPRPPAPPCPCYNPTPAPQSVPSAQMFFVFLSMMFFTLSVLRSS
ncbi:uncharacterized protein [Embiotoca jacksoni]|uniref:uncharacterized protein n=1 Tax=Embiotoca jacksoni TaxID=100190 RepID=UPI0037048A35